MVVAVRTAPVVNVALAAVVLRRGRPTNLVDADFRVLRVVMAVRLSVAVAAAVREEQAVLRRMLLSV